VNRPSHIRERLRVHGARALCLGTIALGLAALSATPASAGDGATTLSAGLGAYVTPATGVVVGSGVSGTATADSENGRVQVEADVRGLQPGTTHAAHVHLGTCVQQLGHFRFDPNGPASRANEVWLDLTANRGGRASAEVQVPAFALSQPLSIVVHQNANPDVVAGSVPGARLACGNLVPPGRLAFAVGPYATAAPGVIANAGAAGRASLVTQDGTTEVRLVATGLDPGSRHAAHVHLGGCAAQLGHFRYEPSGPASRANEIWLDLTADRHGRASARTRVRAIDLGRPLSVVIHQGANPDVVAGSVPGARIACGPVATA
jgi:hypothetical protein